jgi:hypothetical protein
MCIPVKLNWCISGTYRLHLQSQRVTQTKSECEAGSKQNNLYAERKQYYIVYGGACKPISLLPLGLSDEQNKLIGDKGIVTNLCLKRAGYSTCRHELFLSCLLLFVLFLRESYWEQTCWLARFVPTCMILTFLHAVYSACCLLCARFLLLLGLLFDPDDDDSFLQCYFTFTGLRRVLYPRRQSSS